MDDTLYNQVFLKPRFQIDFDMNADFLLEKLKKNIDGNQRFKMKSIDNHIIVDVPEKENHYWSPQLQVEIEELTENRSKIKGLFGPKPQVWTLFMFIHFGVAISVLIFGVVIYSNWSLKKSTLFPIVMLVVLSLLWIVLYGIGTIGKSIGKKQMDELKEFTKQVLKNIK
ncbi:GTP-binding protein [Tenacibaculum sp. nBUS_03]|uniref:GTP-binding protein n=1 Tax=Tenacibaculum sp. nBUS_03 TaxID=3395320 RepID=UPI003EBED287